MISITQSPIPIQRILRLLLFLWTSVTVSAQQPFTEEGQVLTLLRDELFFAEIQIDPGNGAILLQNISPNPVRALDALGFCRSDRMVYGISMTDRHLVRLDANGNTEDLSTTNLDMSLEYLAGDISPDGKTYVVIGSSGGFDRKLYLINLQTIGFPATVVVMPGITLISDIAFDPTIPSLLYGYDAGQRTIVTINISTYSITGLSEISPDNDIQGVYFDAFGRLTAFGTSTSGVAGALFDVDKGNGVITTRSTGPVNRITDIASIPYSIEMVNTPSVRVAFPCEEILYTFTIVNRTGTLHGGIDFEAMIPQGFEFKSIVSNPFGGTVNTSTPNLLRIQGLNLPTGMNELSMNMEVGNAPVGNYRMQGNLTKMPERHGTIILSDDPRTVVMEDSTEVRINRIDQDSITLRRFLCLGESLVLNGGEFGNKILWYNGSTEPFLEVTAGGQYTLQVQGGCESTIVRFNVTEATCPFTIEVAHDILPTETLPCSEVVFGFSIENASGAQREGLLFTDTLPVGMELIEIVHNPFGGHVIDGLSPRIIRIEEMSLPLGTHRMELRVAVGDIAPGEYKNQALLQNFPTELGPRRWSDDPRTPELDSTKVLVLGVESDTLNVDEIICEGSTLLLDGTPYGIEYQWYNGSMDSTLEVSSPGIYELVVFDGCEPTYIFFDVRSGKKIDVTLDTTHYKIHLGDTLVVRPDIFNNGDVLDIHWRDPFDSSMICATCVQAILFPRKSAEYLMYASNEHCLDSISVYVLIDKTRILFIPNAFTPNYDGINDYLSIFSPDFGLIITFDVLDRWGNVMYKTTEMSMNDETTGWDGRYKGREAPAGVYVWNARIRFLDDEVEPFGGAVFILR